MVGLWGAAPAVIAFLTKQRKKEKLIQIACDRDFPVDLVDDSLLEGTVLYEDWDDPDDLVERRLVLTDDFFQIFDVDGVQITVPIKRVISAQALDLRSGTLSLRSGRYSWASAEPTQATPWQRSSKFNADADTADVGCGDLNEVTCRYNPQAAVFVVRTQALHPEPGKTGGLPYTFTCSTLDERDAWLEAFRTVISRFKSLPEPTQWEVLRSQCRDFYHRDSFQITMAGFILANFMCMTGEAQINPMPGSEADRWFEGLEFFFTIVFCAELALNLFSNLVWDFVKSLWNWFDVLVIATAVVSLTGIVDAGGLVHLRLLRAFRVLRFFNRIPSLQKIIVALSASIPAMSNAMALTFMVLAMYRFGRAACSVWDAVRWVSSAGCGFI
jgi:hypothetical protein